MGDFRSAVAATRTAAELEAVVQESIGISGLMEFIRFDAGEILREEQGPDGPKILRLVVGNPIIMKEMLKRVPDAASYAPVTILAASAFIACTSPTIRLRPLSLAMETRKRSQSPRDLDRKIASLLTQAAN